MAALSLYAEIIPFGDCLLVSFIKSNRLLFFAAPLTVHLALKILCLQCSELAWANIISSASVGFRAAFE